MLETSTPGLMWRGLETGPSVPRQSSTLLLGGRWRRDYGSRTEARHESWGSATGPYRGRASALPGGPCFREAVSWRRHGVIAEKAQHTHDQVRVLQRKLYRAAKEAPQLCGLPHAAG